MIYSIQLLRWIAAMMVITVHIEHKSRYLNFPATSMNWIHVGTSGVDIFFIISGFIMCYIIEKKENSPLFFIMSRVKRVIPLYWFLTFIGLIGYIFIPGSVNSSGGETDVIKSFLLIPTSDKFIIQNGWTLSYEFYFYIIFSVFMLFIKNNNRRFVGVGVFITILFLTGKLIQDHGLYIGFLTQSLMIEFVFGMLSYFIYSKFKLPVYLSVSLLGVGIVVMIYNNTLPPIDLRHDRWFVFGVPMFLIFNGLVGMECHIAKLNNKILNIFVLLGNSSYSLYLCHAFVLVVLAKVFTRFNVTTNWAFTLSVFSISIIVSFILYFLVEVKLNKIIRLYKA